MGKAQRPSFPSKSESQYKVGEKVCTDFWGPFRHPGAKGQEVYAVHFTCVQSRFTKVFLLTKRSEQALKCFKEFNLEAKLHGINVQHLKTDGAQEYLSNSMKDYCSANKIKLSHSGPYMHESNGKAERIWRTLTEMAHTYLLTAQLPLKFWTFAIEHAVFVRNRMPHKALDWKTPYELWYGKKPNLSSIRVFGCLAYYYVDVNMRKKLEPRGVISLGLYRGILHRATSLRSEVFAGSTTKEPT